MKELLSAIAIEALYQEFRQLSDPVPPIAKNRRALLRTFQKAGADIMQTIERFERDLRSAP